MLKCVQGIYDLIFFFFKMLLLYTFRAKDRAYSDFFFNALYKFPRSIL